MATVSQGIRISAAVSVSSSRTTNGTSTVYTVPANCFLACSIHMISLPNGGSTIAPHNLIIGGETVSNLGVSGSSLYSGLLTSQSAVLHEAPLANTFFVGPGETISHSATFAGTGTAIVRVVGTLFINS